MKTKKRNRGPRVSTYVSEAEKRRLLKEAELRDCDASVVFRDALQNYLDQGLCHGPSSSAIQDGLAKIIFDATALFQCVDQAEILQDFQSPLANHIDGIIYAGRLDEIIRITKKLVVQVAALRAELKLQPKKLSSRDPKGNAAGKGKKGHRYA